MSDVLTGSEASFVQAYRPYQRGEFTDFLAIVDRLVARVTELEQQTEEDDLGPTDEGEAMSEEQVAMRAAIKFARSQVLGVSTLYSDLRDAFMMGALWQAEQDRLAVQAAATGTEVERRARDRDVGE